MILIKKEGKYFHSQKENLRKQVVFPTKSACEFLLNYWKKEEKEGSK